MELPKGAEGRETRSLKPEEARRLVETALLDLDDLVFVFALFTGMRPKEYLGLPLSNVEPVGEECAVVHVTQQAVKVRRGGHKFTKPKTKKGVRPVPISGWLYRELMRLKEANEERARLAGAEWTDYGLVFPSRTGKPISENWLRAMFARLLKRAGLPAHYTPYSLRYTYNTLLSEGGVAARPGACSWGTPAKPSTSRSTSRPSRRCSWESPRRSKDRFSGRPVPHSHPARAGGSCNSLITLPILMAFLLTSI